MIDTVTAPPKHTITALVQNETGTINRLVSLFRRRGFSIDCFNAGDCEIPGCSRITLVVNGTANELNQCLKQLEKLIDVIEVEDLQPDAMVARELALVRTQNHPDSQPALERVCAEFGARVAKRAGAGVILEIVATGAEILQFLEAVQPLGIEEVVRTGVVAIKAEA